MNGDPGKRKIQVLPGFLVHGSEGGVLGLRPKTGCVARKTVIKIRSWLAILAGRTRWVLTLTHNKEKQPSKDDCFSWLRGWGSNPRPTGYTYPLLS
jgi:hypothetical protein